MRYIYDPAFDLSKIPPNERERFKQHQITRGLQPFEAVVLHCLTLGIFGAIYCGLKHSKLPRISPTDLSAGKAVGLALIPIFNVYWWPIVLLRLVDRINLQLRLRDRRDALSRPLLLSMVVSFVICWLASVVFSPLALLTPVFLAIVLHRIQTAWNWLALEAEAPQALRTAGPTETPPMLLRRVQAIWDYRTGGPQVSGAVTAGASDSACKQCPDCAESIKLEALVCRFCGHRFEEADVRSQVEAFREQQVGAQQLRQQQAVRGRELGEKITEQMALYRNFHGQKAMAITLFIISGLFVVVLILSWIIPPETLQQESRREAIIRYSVWAAIIVVPGFFAERARRVSKLLKRDLDERVNREGNYYRCRCGELKRRYGWLHVLLSILVFPIGLISLYFLCTKCRNCGTDYLEG